MSLFEGIIKIEESTLATIFSTFWWKNDYSAIFLWRDKECWTSPSMIFKTTLQEFGLSKIVVYVHLYRQIKKQMCIFSKKKVFVIECVWYDEYLERIFKKSWPWFIFLPISQNQFYHRVSLSHAGTQIRKCYIAIFLFTLVVWLYFIFLKTQALNNIFEKR